MADRQLTGGVDSTGCGALMARVSAAGLGLGANLSMERRNTANIASSTLDKSELLFATFLLVSPLYQYMNKLIFWPKLWAIRLRPRFLSVILAFLVPVLSARATTVIPPEFPELVNQADYVVRAVVKSVTSEWRETGGQRSIFTLVELDVKEVIAGSPPQPLVLQLLGGRVGEEELRIAGAPKFKIGDEDILFVQGNGRNAFPLVAIMHGRYPVLKETGTGRQYVARSNHTPLQDTAEVALPIVEGQAAPVQQRRSSPASALTPAEFVQRIKAAVDPSSRRVQQN
jgi:hypothetical protein